MARFGTQGSQSIALLTGKIEALKAEMVNIKDISVLAKFNQEIEASELQLGRMSNAGKTGFNELGVAVKGMGNPLSKGYGLLRKLAYVLPGIGISGIVAFATGPIIDYVESLTKANDAIDLAKNNLQNFNDIMEDASKKAGEQTADLKILYQAATDVNLSMRDRLAAAKELKKEYPEEFANLSALAIANGKAKSSYEELTKSIIDNAVATAAKDKIEALESKKMDNFAQRTKVLVATTNEYNAALAESKKATSSSSASSFGATLTSKGSQEADFKTIIHGIDYRRKKALDDLAKSDKSFDDQIAAALNFGSGEAAVAAAIERADTTKDKKGKKTNPFEISLKELEDNYKQAQALLVSQYDANTSDAKKNTTVVNDLLLKAQQDFLEKKLALIKQYGKKEGDVDLEIAKNQRAIIANQLSFQIEQLNSLPKVQNAPSINFTKATTAKIDPKPILELSDAIKKNIKAQQDQLDLMNETAVALNKTVGPAFDTLFTNILEGSGNAFKAFGDAIKQMLVQLGAAILKAALFAAILSVINPGVKTATGVPGITGKSGFGDIFKSLLGFSKGGAVKGFATGGVIDGPGTSTSDSILARLSKGEYIINAGAVSKFGASFFDNINSGLLPKFNRGGPVGSNLVVATNTFIPDVTLKGQDLIIAFNRANQRASRNG
jgi:hypothetical protein